MKKLLKKTLGALYLWLITRISSRVIKTIGKTKKLSKDNFCVTLKNIKNETDEFLLQVIEYNKNGTIRKSGKETLINLNENDFSTNFLNKDFKYPDILTAFIGGKGGDYILEHIYCNKEHVFTLESYLEYVRKSHYAEKHEPAVFTLTNVSLPNAQMKILGFNYTHFDTQYLIKWFPLKKTA